MQEGLNHLYNTSTRIGRREEVNRNIADSKFDKLDKKKNLLAFGLKRIDV